MTCFLTLVLASVVLEVKADPVFRVNDDYPLAIDVTGLDEACTILWERTDGIGARMSQSFAKAAVIQLLRFTPNQEYKFQVLDSAGRAVGSMPYYTCTASKTGIPQYDADAPFAAVTGHPTFETLVVGHAGALVAIDNQGWVVWHLPGGNGAWDQLSAAENYNIVTLAGFGTLESSGLKELSVTGKQVRSANFPALSHEAHVDAAIPGEPVLSIQSETRNFSGLANPQSGSKLVQWDRHTGALDTLYNLFDFYNPVTDFGECSRIADPNASSACFPPQSLTYTGSQQDPLADDWSHANSAARGTQNNYIMSVRHLSSVVSFHADGSGIQWILSGEGVRPSKAPSAMVLKYTSADERQYMQHCARQLDNGNVILFDNGDLRQPPFTRFAEYEIDTDKGVAKLVWQFVPKLHNASSGQPMFAFHAGSVYRLENGHTVGACSCDNDRVGSDCTHVAFEANQKGEEICRLVVPKPLNSSGHDFGYRGLPIKTLGGEHVEHKVGQSVIV